MLYLESCVSKFIFPFPFLSSTSGYPDPEGMYAMGGGLATSLKSFKYCECLLQPAWSAMWVWYVFLGLFYWSNELGRLNQAQPKVFEIFLIVFEPSLVGSTPQTHSLNLSPLNLSPLYNPQSQPLSSL